MNTLSQAGRWFGHVAAARLVGSSRGSIPGSVACLLVACFLQMGQRALGQFPGGTVQQHVNQARQQARSHSIRQQGRWHGEQGARAQALRHSPLYGGSTSNRTWYVQPRQRYYHVEPTPRWMPAPPQIHEGDWVVTTVDAPAKRGSRKLTTVGAQSKLNVVEVRGDWIGLKFWQEGRYFEGWIHARYLAKTAAPPPAAPAPAPAPAPPAPGPTLSGPPAAPGAPM